MTHQHDVESHGQASADEIKVTPEMIDAGLSELVLYEPGWDVGSDVVREIYEAMEKARLGSMTDTKLKIARLKEIKAETKGLTQSLDTLAEGPELNRVVERLMALSDELMTISDSILIAAGVPMPPRSHAMRAMVTDWILSCPSVR